MPYVELRAHTGFSFGDGSATPEALIRYARCAGYTHIGITDTADLGGIPRAFREAARPSKGTECAEQEHHGSAPCPVCQRPVNLIAGAELTVDGRPAAFLARDETGCRNLATLITLSRMGCWDTWDKEAQQQHRGRPNLSWGQVAAHSTGLHALTGPASGPLASLVLRGDTDAARRMLRQWREAFDEGDRLAVEVQLHHAGGRESALAGALVALAEQEGVPWVVTHDPRYVSDGGRLVHDMLTALRHEATIQEAAARGLLHPNGDWRLLPPAAMARRWEGRLEGLRESERIGNECAFALEWLRPPLPRFDALFGGDDNRALRERTYAGARERWGESLSAAQLGQLEHELELISRLGFSGFFLVMWDAVRFARGCNILCQGRGSAANSAVAYCLGITAVDPVRHGLLFERFLSDARVGVVDEKVSRGVIEAPDIDVDFEHDRREEVLDYMYATYRRDQAAIVCTVQTYRAPNAVQDAMRALGYPVELAVTISKRVHRYDPADAVEPIRETLAAEAGLNLNDARGRALLCAITAFDGLPRLRSTHVGGFVLSAEALGGYLPIEQTTMGRTILQFDKDDLDDIGVPKFDFLGLGALSMIRRAFDVIERRTGNRPMMYALPQDDPATYELIQRGDTIGMFQIESRAQISSILHTRPELLYDLVVQVALIRPGPIQAKFVHPYTERRRGREDVVYRHPKLEPILRRTQGIPIFQEQAMAIAMALGNYTGAQADEMRRAMGNMRKHARLTSALEQLEAAMIHNPEDPVDPEVAHQLCEDFKSFSNYGFPESHAWSFALIAYVTAYLKAHYPAELFCGLLNSLPMGFYPIGTLIHDARRTGVPFLPPCLRDGNSEGECTVEETDDPMRPALRIGWQHVRGVGARTIDTLRDVQMAGPFISIADVVTRARLSRADVIAFTRAGAFGAWAADRRQAAWEGLRASGDILPLAPASRVLHDPPPMARDRLVLLDYDATGLSLNGHPMDALRAGLVAEGAVASWDLPALDGGSLVTVGGLVTVRQQPQTSKGTIFLLLEDERGFINVIVSKTMVEKNERVVKEAPFMRVTGKLEKSDAAINVVGQRFSVLETPTGVERIAHLSHDFH